MDLCQKIEDCLLERLCIGEIPCSQYLCLDKFPKAFDEVQVGRVRGKELQGDIESFGLLLDPCTVLVSGVVQKNVDGQPGISLADLLEHGHYGLRSDVGGVVQDQYRDWETDRKSVV